MNNKGTKLFALIACILVAIISFGIMVNADDDKVSGEKTVEWADQENGIAKVTMTIENTLETKIEPIQTRIVLVIDSSGSMGESATGSGYSTKMAAVKAASKQFVTDILAADGNAGNVQIAVVQYASSSSQRIGFSSNTNAINTSIDELQADGATHIQAGIHQAQALLNTVSYDNEFIVLLSDGAPTYSYRAVVSGVQWVRCTGSGGAWDTSSHANLGVWDESNMSVSFNYNNTVGNGSSFSLGDSEKFNMSYQCHTGFWGIGWRENQYYYPANNGISTIHEADFAKNQGSKIYTISYFPPNTDAINTLNGVSSGVGYAQTSNNAAGAFDHIKEQIQREIGASAGTVTDYMGSSSNLSYSPAPPYQYQFKIITGDPTCPITATHNGTPWPASSVNITEDNTKLEWKLYDEDNKFLKGTYVLIYYVKMDPTAFEAGGHLLYANNGAEISYVDSSNPDEILTTKIDDPSITFNKNRQKAAERVIAGTKVLNGTMPLVNGAFGFSLETADSATADAVSAGDIVMPASPVQNVGAAFAFDSITFMAEGTYTFTVKEEIPAEVDRTPGVSYDSKEYTITISVALNGTSTEFEIVSFLIDNGDETKISFTNSFTDPSSEPVVVSGTKTLTGGSLADGLFSFKIEGADDTTKEAIVNDGVLMGTSQVYNDAAGMFVFDDIRFKSVGQYTFKVSEVIPADANKLPGVAYDANDFTITVDVTYDNLTKQYMATLDPSNPTISFTNAYSDPTSEPVSISGTKALTNGTLAAGDFSFNIVGKDLDTIEAISDGNISIANAVVSNDEDGNFTFGNITFTNAGEYTFVVSEVIPDDEDKLPGLAYDASQITLTINVYYDLPTKKFIAVPDDENPAVVFTNVYSDPTSDALSIGGTKTLTNADLEEGFFSFRIAGADTDTTAAIDNGDISIGNAVVTNDANGNFIFANITFSAIGNYLFTVTEVNPGLSDKIPGVAYDPREFTVPVSVTYSYDSKKYMAVLGSFNALDFVNVYTDAVIFDGFSATKRMTTDSADTVLKNNQFTFTIAAQGNAPVPNVTAVKNTAAGLIADILQGVEFCEEGNYVYTITEDSTTKEPGYVYDSSRYDVTISVSRDAVANTFSAEISSIAKDGETIATNASGSIDTEDYIVFVNANYRGVIAEATLPPVTVSLSGRNMKAGEFIFTVDASSGAPVLNPVSLASPAGADGVAMSVSLQEAFAGVKFPYSADPYVYTIKEVNGGSTISGVTYDGTQYQIVVETIVGADNTIVPTIKINEVQGNGVREVSVAAFENLYNAESASVTIAGKKTLTNHAMLNGKFKFTISSNNADAPLPSITEVANAYEDVVFGAITFDQSSAGASLASPKEYIYRISEVDSGKTIDGITYDTRVCEVVVQVYDDALGQINARVVSPDSTKTAFEFVNTYAAAPASLSFMGKKTLNGRALAGGDFSFEVINVTTGSQNEVVSTGTNNKNGDISFSMLSFNKPGTYSYTIKEKNVGKPGYTYDLHEVQATVEVVDNGNGQLVASIISDTEIAFVNSYAAAETALRVNASVSLEGRALADKEFEFILKSIDNAGFPKGFSLTAVNDGNGNILFDSLEFTKVGTYIFEVSQISAGDNTVVYDRTVKHITIVVTDPGDGVLKAEVQYDDGDLHFINTIKTGGSDDPDDPDNPDNPDGSGKKGPFPDTGVGGKVFSLLVSVLGCALLVFLLMTYNKKGRRHFELTSKS